MKVYVLTEYYPYESTTVLGVFQSVKAAKAYADEECREYTPLTWTTENGNHYAEYGGLGVELLIRKWEVGR